MPIDYRIDWTDRIVVMRARGVFRQEDATEYQREVWMRPDTQGFDELADMSQVTEIAIPPPSSGVVQALAEASAALDAAHTHAKLAIVATNDLTYGLGRMFQAYRSLDARSTRHCEVFRTHAEAFTFLGRESVEFPPSGES